MTGAVARSDNSTDSDVDARAADAATVPDGKISNSKPHLKTQLQKFLQYYTVRSAPSTSKVVKTAKKIDSAFAALPTTPAAIDLDEIAAKFTKAIESNAWGAIGEKDWRWAPYLLFVKNTFDEKELGKNSEFLEKLFDRFERSPRASTHRQLIFLYLQNLNRRNAFPDAYRLLKSTIEKALEKYSLSLAVWQERHSKYELFSPDTAATKLTTAFLRDAGSDFQAFATLTGLQGELENVGCIEEVGKRLLIETWLDEADLLRSILSFHLNNRELRCRHLQAQLIERLLQPWVKTDSKVDEQTRKQIQDLVINRFGDPRIPSCRNSEWSGVSDRAVQVVYQWLAGRSLEQFFSIIDQQAYERQWKYRKAFWKAYYDKGYLTEAWVAMGSDAVKTAHSIYGEDIVGAVLRHTSYKKDQSHSVLLLKLANLTFAVWSHEGKCRAWSEGQKGIPTLYKTKYDHNEFKVPSMQIVREHKDDGISHLSSDTYWWQNKLSNFIEYETGIRMIQHDFQI